MRASQAARLFNIPLIMGYGYQNPHHSVTEHKIDSDKTLEQVQSARTHFVGTYKRLAAQKDETLYNMAERLEVYDSLFKVWHTLQGKLKDLKNDADKTTADWEKQAILAVEETLNIYEEISAAVKRLETFGDDIKKDLAKIGRAKKRERFLCELDNIMENYRAIFDINYKVTETVRNSCLLVVIQLLDEYHGPQGEVKIPDSNSEASTVIAVPSPPISESGRANPAPTPTSAAGHVRGGGRGGARGGASNPGRGASSSGTTPSANPGLLAPPSGATGHGRGGARGGASNPNPRGGGSSSGAPARGRGGGSR